jgi:hypothetical protein
VHGLQPDDLKHLSHLNGGQVIQVCVGEYNLQFNFHPQGNVSVEGRCELLNDSGAILDVWDKGARSEVFRFLEVLGEPVTEVVIDSPRSFKLAFPKGQWLRIVDNSELYESFSIGGFYV